MSKARRKKATNETARPGIYVKSGASANFMREFVENIRAQKSRDSAENSSHGGLKRACDRENHQTKQSANTHNSRVRAVDDKGFGDDVAALIA